MVNRLMQKPNFTGRYCWRSRLKRSVRFGYAPPLIGPDRLTVPAMLRDAGYHTACIGKWHLGLGYSTRPGKHPDFNAPLPWNNATRDDEESIDYTNPLIGGSKELGFDVFYGTSGCSTLDAMAARIGTVLDIYSR